MQPNYSESLKFLRKWKSSGPWVLTAIPLDKRNLETTTLRDTDAALEWLTEHGSDKNIYFSVNSVLRDVLKKPMREDVRSMDWLHVDIDPRAGEDQEMERARILSMLTTPPAPIPPPTVIVFSGGGYQGFWRLMEPFDIDGQESKFEEAKRYNQALELAFGADPCHNVDRIMRLPGTINRPDARKIKKGRTEALAALHYWDATRVYPLTDFSATPSVQTDRTGFSSTNRVQVSGNIKRIADLMTELPDKVGHLCRTVIAQGSDPDDPTRFPSRSEALFFVCCELVRSDVDNDTIYAIVTDPDWAISSSVLDKGSSADAYAKRQIERAREDAEEPWLRKLNDRYAVVAMGGKMRVVYEDYDELLERHRLVKMTFEDFRNCWMHIRVQIGTDAQGNPRQLPLGKWWLENDKRRQYEKLVFAPRREVDMNSYNMWRGFAVEPRLGNKHDSFLEHILSNVCGSDKKIYDYFVGWMSRMIQEPWTPGETAIVLRGPEGVGKGFVAKTQGRLFGRHYVHVSTAQHLTGNFNAHLRDCVFLFADEAFYAGDKKHASTLKSLVTEPTIMVEPKGVDTETTPNCLHLMMASNEDWVVPASAKDRRFCVLDVGEDRIQDVAYFSRIAGDLRDGGYENLLYFLMNYDLRGYNVRAIPKTSALQDQKILSFSAEEEWWFSKLRDGKIMADHESWQTEVVVEQLTADFINYTRAFNISRRGSATKLGHFLRRACPDNQLTRLQASESITIRLASGEQISLHRPYLYRVPELAELRAHWDMKFGGPYRWPSQTHEMPHTRETPF